MMEWRKGLNQFLKNIGIVKDDYTGKLVLNMNQGNVTDAHKVTTTHEGDCKIERTERIK
jgi:hypothetical protein